MSLPGKKGRDLSQLPTLSYEIKLNLPINADSNPQEISFLDLITNDTKFKNDKESLELVLSSYVKACGKQSVKEILAERDTIVNDDNASLSNIIRALMDYNDQQNANLGVGYNDPDDDDSFIDDSTAAQDIIPRNMTNERDGFYVNEKHQPIQARYLSEASESDSEDGEEDDDDDDDSEDDDSTDSEKEDKQNKKINNNEEDINEKNAKKSKTDQDGNVKLLNAKRKRSISEVTAPSLPLNLENKTTSEEPVKKVKKLSETTSESSTQSSISYVLPNEMENDIKLSIEKIVKFIVSEQTMNNKPKKIARLFESSVCREFLDLLKKLHRHTNANRQLVFDILSSKTGICPPILITRARSVLLNDYEPTIKSIPLNDLKEKLKNEINRSLEFHIQAHNQAIKEWQQKMAENPSKDKIRGPRKNFRLYKTINELIIRCIDRKLESLTMCDTDSLEAFLIEHIVPLWEKPGWMTAKKIISEVIRIEYRPLRDVNPPQTSQATKVIPTSTSPAPERIRKESQPLLPPPSPKISSTNPSPTKIPQPQTIKTNDTKPIVSSLTNNNNSAKSLEMATRVTTNPVKQHTSRPVSTESSINQLTEQSTNKTNKSDVIRPIAKPVIVSPSPQLDSSIKRHSTPNLPSVTDLSMDLYSQYKKRVEESSTSSSRINSQPSVNKDLSQRATSSPTNNSKQQQQQQQFATKLPSEKSPAGSFLKEALLTGASSSPKISASPLAVDNMINKSVNSPKTNTNTSTIKSSTTLQSPTTNTQRSSSSNKSTSNRPSNELSHHRTDQQIVQQHKTSSSSSSTRPSSSSASSSISPASRRPTTGFTSAHEQQSSRSHSSQVSLPPPLSQSIQWDSATLQLAAAALANPQLLNPSVFDPSLFNSMFGNMTSTSPSSSRQQHSQNTNNNRRT